MKQPGGLHHVTAIAGPPQENLDFYTGVLGLRLVKKSVNQDDPGTYHLFYADAEGHPGTDVTFFPWTQLAPRRDGHGLSSELTLSVPLDSLSFWSEQLRRFRAKIYEIEKRFGRRTLPFEDPHGLRLALVENDDSLGHRFTAWEHSPVPVEYQIRGLESARLIEHDLSITASFLSAAMGFRRLGSENGWERYGLGGGASGHYLDLCAAPNERRGIWGTGSIHHLAWRVEDDAHQLEVRSHVAEAGSNPTAVIDRFWFKSVYFREPGGVLFELATDEPGFAVDEDRERLGEALVLPPWLEPSRITIEAQLPRLNPLNDTRQARPIGTGRGRRPNKL